MNLESNNERINAVVKWYKPEKGYGFVINENIEVDIFIHFSALDTASLSRLDEGDEIVCDIGEGPTGGLQVIKIIEVRFMQREKWSPPAFLEGRIASYNGDIIEIEGEIKWFNPIKGFGFIYPDDNGRDIYLPAYVLHNAGFERIDGGVRVAMKVISSKKGREAREIIVL